MIPMLWIKKWRQRSNPKGFVLYTTLFHTVEPSGNIDNDAGEQLAMWKSEAWLPVVQATNVPRIAEQVRGGGETGTQAPWI